MAGDRRTHRKATAKDVAVAAGVSPATVDRVLNGRGGVAPDKARRVLEYARLLRLDRSLDRWPAKTLRIVLLIQSGDNPFHAALRAALNEAEDVRLLFDLQGFVHSVDPNDAKATAHHIRSFGEAYDGLIVVCPDRAEIADAIRSVAARRPVVTLATDLPGSGRQAYVGPDDRRSGRVAGDLMGRFLGPGGGAILVIAGLFSMTGQRERLDGFAEVLTDRYPACRIVDVVESRELAERAGTLAAGALLNTPGIRGLYNASVGSRTVADAIAGAGRTGDVVFITHELTTDRRRLLQEGRIDAVIDQDPVNEMKVALRTMAMLLGRANGEALDVPTGLHIHMRENG